jgi:SMC interacting uncharacterized protein involved in chromosome segregation
MEHSGEILTLEGNSQDKLNFMATEYSAEVAKLNAKIQRDGKELEKLTEEISGKFAEIESLRKNLEVERKLKSENEIEEKKWREKFENLSSEKNIEIKELQELHDTLKTKSKKLLLSQKQLLTENKSLKAHLVNLNSSAQSDSNSRSGLVQDNDRLVAELQARLLYVSKRSSHFSQF